MKKQFLLPLLMIAFTSAAFSQKTTYQLSSHILDIIKGQPAPEVKIKLEKMTADFHWKLIDKKFTDKNGRVTDFLKNDGSNHEGVYKLTFLRSRTS